MKHGTATALAAVGFGVFGGVTGPSVAAAGPSLRFGVTGAVSDQSAPDEQEFGPMVALGERFGFATVEADYAYLSFLNPDTGPDGMQRVGLNVRGDLLRKTNHYCFLGMACTRGAAIYAEAGVAERFGQWHLDSVARSPAEGDRSHEEHIGAGIELDNHLFPRRYGWQFGVRLALSPHDPYEIDTSCRGACALTTGTTTKPGGQDRAVLLEWTFLIGS